MRVGYRGDIAKTENERGCPHNYPSPQILGGAMTARQAVQQAMRSRRLLCAELARICGVTVSSLTLTVEGESDMFSSSLVKLLNGCEYDLLAVPRDYREGSVMLKIDLKVAEPGELPFKEWKVRDAPTDESEWCKVKRGRKKKGSVKRNDKQAVDEAVVGESEKR